MSPPQVFEVELKFPVPDFTSMRERLESLHARPEPICHQCDSYFNHPARDFQITDEALRIRATAGRPTVVTYKGPLLDRETKTRREIEIELGPDPAAAGFQEMLGLLGFRFVRAVRKHRQPYHLQIDGRTFECALDDVENLGTFVEIETLADELQRIEAQRAVLELARGWNLPQPERRAYLTMLLECDRIALHSSG